MKPLHLLGMFASVHLIACTASSFDVVVDPASEAAAPSSGSPVGPVGSQSGEATSQKGIVLTAPVGECPKNGCGGCGALVGDPGTTCGTNGVWRCAADRASVYCEEATKAAGCDRIELTDAAHTGSGFGPPTWFDDEHTVAIGHTMRTEGAITQVKLLVGKQDWAGIGIEGNLKLEVFQGMPGAPGVTKLGEATHEPSITVGEIGEISFSLVSPTVTLPKGTTVYFQLSSDVHRYRYHLNGASGGVPEFPFYSRLSPTATWTPDPTDFQPHIEVNVLGCP